MALALEHRRRGSQVDLITLLPNEMSADELLSAGVTVHELDFKSGGPAGTLLQLRRLIDARAPSIVHSHLFHSNIACRFALRGSRPLVCTIHSSAETSAVRYAIYRLTDRWCDLTTIVSQKGVESFLKMKGSSRRDKVRVMKNGLAVDDWSAPPEARTRLRDELGLGDAFAWIAVGRHMWAKNYPLLLAAFAEHRKHRPNSILLMVGKREEGNALESQAGPGVRFLGPRSDIRDLLAAADAHVMSSRLEGLPMVLLEASCAGLYSVCTDVGAISQVLDRGRLGHVVPSEDSTALREALNDVSDLSREALLRKGAEVRDFVREYYAIDKVVDEWIDLYAGIAHS